MAIKFIEKDRVWQNETINYWFDVDGVMFAPSFHNGNVTLLDNEGYPIDRDNDVENILDQLIENLTVDIFLE